jgi:uncharacterized protein DUF1573
MGRLFTGFCMKIRKLRGGFMILKNIFAGIMIFVFGATAVLAQSAGPKIAVVEMRHDFGIVAQGTQVEHVFEIKNVGTGQLIIERVQSS